MFRVCSQLSCSLQDTHNIQNTVSPLSGIFTHYIQFNAMSSSQNKCHKQFISTLDRKAVYIAHVFKNSLHTGYIEGSRNIYIQYSDWKVLEGIHNILPVLQKRGPH